MNEDKHNLFSFLKEISQLSSEAEQSLLSLSSLTTIKKGADLQPIGHTCKTIYFVKNGLARIYYYKDGNDVTEYFAFDNDIIIRAESLFTGKPSQKAIQAMEDTVFISIPSEQLFGLFERYHDLERLFRKIFEKAYVETLNRMESIQFHSAEERYQDLLNKTPDLLKRISLKHIASYLGITPVSLSRIRANQF
ncbi:MAG: Crp/Fnr family transcriptional regulator [Cyclobacteriaceae bacterium]